MPKKVKENFTEKRLAARNYKIMRLFSGKSQAEIEADTGISKQNLSTWENEKGNPGPEFIDQLSKYFGLQKDLFLKDGLTIEYLQNMKNNASVPNEAAINGKPLREKDLYREMYEKFLGEDSQYLLIHKELLKEHRLIPIKEMELNADNQVKVILELTARLGQLAERPINIHFPNVEKT